MIRRWPIRVRLAAAFTTMMALVLLAVAWVTLHQSREALDESTNTALSNRLGRLLAIGATPSGPGLPGGTEGGLDQILSPSGQLIATTGEQTDPPLLAGAELAAARRAIFTVEHPSVHRIPGPVRIMAAATPDGNAIAATAMSLANRDAVVADLRRELTVAFPLVLLAAAVGAYLLAAAALRPVEQMRATIRDWHSQDIRDRTNAGRIAGAVNVAVRVTKCRITLAQARLLKYLNNFHGAPHCSRQAGTTPWRHTKTTRTARAGLTENAVRGHQPRQRQHRR